MKNQTHVNLSELTNNRIAHEVTVIEGQLKFFNSELKKPTMRDSFAAIQLQAREKLSRLWVLRKELTARGGRYA